VAGGRARGLLKKGTCAINGISGREFGGVHRYTPVLCDAQRVAVVPLGLGDWRSVDFGGKFDQSMQSLNSVDRYNLSLRWSKGCDESPFCDFEVISFPLSSFPEITAEGDSSRPSDHRRRPGEYIYRYCSTFRREIGSLDRGFEITDDNTAVV
jgi:hypothetical protein